MIFCHLQVVALEWLSAVAGWYAHVSRFTPSMEAEGAEQQLAPDEGQEQQQPTEVAALSATVVEEAPLLEPESEAPPADVDSQYQRVKRAFYQGYERARQWLLDHTKPRHNKDGFYLFRPDFDSSSRALQELLINWDFFVTHATQHQLLCEFEVVVPQFATWVSHHGFSGEGGTLAAHLRNRTRTLATLVEGSGEPEDRTYRSVWEEAEDEARQDQPIRPRQRTSSKPAGKGTGAASSAPGGRTSSLGSWVGREFIPEEDSKGKGKSKWIPKTQGTPSPKTPEGPPPPHHPRQPNSPPPSWRPSLGKGAGTSNIPAPPAGPPTVFVPPTAKSVPPARTPPVPPPAKSAQRPVEDPQPPQISIKSRRLNPVSVEQDTTSPGASLSPESKQPVNKPAPAEGAAPGAPQDPEPEGSEEGDWEQEEGEEEDSIVEDPIVEVADSSQRRAASERPPAVVLRGRSQARTPPPSRTSLEDRPVVLRPARHLAQHYPQVRIDRRGAWARAAAPAHAAIQTGLVSVPVARDRHVWGEDPHSHADELWRDPQSISSVQVPNPDIVTNFEDIDPPLEYVDYDAEPPTPFVAGVEEAGEGGEEEVLDDDLDIDEIEELFLSRVRPPSRRPRSRPASASRRVFLQEEQGAAESAPVEGSSSTLDQGAAAPSAPKRRKKDSKIPKEDTGSLSPPTDVGVAPVADPNWFVDHSQQPAQTSVASSSTVAGPKKTIFKHTPASLQKNPPQSKSVPIQPPQAKHKPAPKIPGVNVPRPEDIPQEQKSQKAPPPPAREPPKSKVAAEEASASRPDPPELPVAAKSATQGSGTRRPPPSQPQQADYSCLVPLSRTGMECHHAVNVIGGINPRKTNVGLDWHRVISPHCIDRQTKRPSPLFALQLKEIAETYNVQYWVVSFTGYASAETAREEITEFVAWCVSVCGLPFSGFRITKSPIGQWGKASVLPDLNIQVFIDDRGDVCNEVKKTGIRVLQADGHTGHWTFDLLQLFRDHGPTIARIIPRNLEKHEFSIEPPGRRGY